MTHPVQYNLQDKHTRQWLTRWPSKGGAPALFSSNRHNALTFDVSAFNDLAGLWDYARADCIVVHSNWNPDTKQFITLAPFPDD